MRTNRVTTQILFCTAVLLVAGCLPASADPMTLGSLSFDSIIVGISDQFTISNFSGIDLPPDLPVITSVTFQNAELALFGPSIPASPILLGDIIPGMSASGLISDASQITSAVFTATLSETILSLDGGGTETVDSLITATLSPSSGLYLLAGTDSTVIEATAPTTALAEPSTSAIAVSLIGLAALMSLIRRRVWREADRFGSLH